MNKEKAMSAGSKNLIIRTTLRVALVFALPSSAALHSQVRTSPKSIASASSQTTQSGFATPQEAAAALIKAAGNYDLPALKAMFGPDGEDLVSTPDPVQGKNQIAEFAERAQEKNSVAIDPKSADHATLLVGEQEWPLPIPLAKKGTKWYFDAKAGRREILYRRVGENELDAIQICRGYVEAQEEYASTIHDDSGVNQYAQRQGVKGPGPCGTAGTARLHDRGSDDRWLRASCLAGGISSHGRANIHGQLQRHCLSKGLGMGFRQDCSRNGALQPGQDLASHR
jgi:hypothetical protein